MTKVSPVSRRKVSDLLAVRDLANASATFIEDFAANGTSRFPLRVALESKSSFDFLDDVATTSLDALVSEGVAADVMLAQSLAATVAADPALCMTNRAGDGILRILQAVVVNPARDDIPFDVCVALHVEIRPQGFEGPTRKPPTVLSSSVEVMLFDLEDEAELGRLAETVASWTAKYPAPPVGNRRNEPTVVLLGDLSACCTDSPPSDWREQLRRLIGSFGRTAMIVGKGGTFSSDIATDTELVVQFDPYGGRAPNLPPGLSVKDIQPRTLSFTQVKARLAAELTRHPEEAAPLIASLAPGQRIFHRKIGNSQKFDTFDEGSPTPCKHGADGFVVFRGPKSVKGFQRRYSNFTPEMLRHCSKYPNCGMYAVFA